MFRIGLIDKYNGSKAIDDDNLPKFVSEGFEDYFNNFPECNVGFMIIRMVVKRKISHILKLKKIIRKG